MPWRSLKRVLVAGAQGHHPAHVGLVEGGQDGRALLHLHQPFGDPLAQRRHGRAGLALCHQLDELSLGCGRIRGRSASTGAAGAAPDTGPIGWRARLPMLVDVAHHVRLGDPPVPAAACDGRRIQVVLHDHALHGRRQPLERLQLGSGLGHAGGRAQGCRGDRRRWRRSGARVRAWRLLGFGDGLLLGRHRPGLGLGVDGGHHLAHLDRRALGYQDLELAGGLGVDGHRDLVRLEHQQRLLDFDPVTVGLGPLGEDALGDGLADLGDFHFRGIAFTRHSRATSPQWLGAGGRRGARHGLRSGIISNPGHAWGSGSQPGPPSASATTAACCLRCTRREPVAGLALGSRPA